MKIEMIVADNIAFSDPAPGTVIPMDKVTEGLNGETESLDLKKVITTLARWHGVRANLVNGLWFHAGDNPLDRPAERYLPTRDRPAEGIRIQDEQDDPFAVLAAGRSVRRALNAPPRTARKLDDQVKTGVISASQRDEILSLARNQITPEDQEAARLMLPA